MKCLNPGCPGSKLPGGKFTARRLRGKRHQNETHPESIHVLLKCDYCGREIKSWITHEDLKRIYAKLELIEKCQERQESLLKEILKQLKSKNWFERILERILKRA